MALLFYDRVKETTTTTGTGSLTLLGAVAGYQSFSAVGDGNTCYYCVEGGTQWEVGFGTYAVSGTTLARTSVLASSNSGSLVSFSAGTKNVFVTIPAAAAAVYIGTGAPSNPFERQLWWKSDEGTLKIYYNDGTSSQWVDASPIGVANTVIESLIVACSDETTVLTAGTAKVTFRMSYAFNLTGVRASLTTAQASGSIFTVDINQAGVSILSTKLTIDNTQKTSTTATTPAVISNAALTDDAEMTVDIDQVGDGTAKGLKLCFIGTK